MKKAKLVKYSFMTRVIADESATEDDIIIMYYSDTRATWMIK